MLLQLNRIEIKLTTGFFIKNSNIVKETELVGLLFAVVVVVVELYIFKGVNKRFFFYIKLESKYSKETIETV